MYYKLIPENYIKLGSLIDTNDDNYGKFLDKITSTHKKLFDSFIEIDEKLEAGMDLYYILYNHLKFFGKRHIDSLGEHISLSSFTGNDDHGSATIEKKELYRIIKIVSNYEVGVLSNGTLLWEYLFEKRRKEKYSTIISRLNSYFVFKNENDCIEYFNRHKKNGQIVEIEPLKIDKIFEGDMQLMDCIENYFTISTINKIIDEYWEGKKTNKPIVEVLLSGKIRQKRIIGKSST